jgi:hypothetical protein
MGNYHSAGRRLLILATILAATAPENVNGQSNDLLVSSVTLAGTNLVVSGTGALAGATYYVLASTNLMDGPVASWSKIASNTFAASGAFTTSVAIDPASAEEFFAIDMTLPDQSSPSAPPLLLATGVRSNQVNLSWFPATDNVGVVAYYVERQDPGSTNFVQIGVTTGTTFTDTGLLADTNYVYRVRAVDAAMNLGMYSAVAGAITFPRVVAAFAFDEGSGTTATNASGLSNNGTISGATWTNSGKYGNALFFNGTSALVTIADSTALHLTTGFTLEAWVNPSAVSAVWRDVIYKYNDNYYLEATSQFNGWPAAGGNFGSPAAPGQTLGASTLTTQTWTHLAATYDGAMLRLYVNGAEASSVAQTGNVATSTNPLQIGGDSNYVQRFTGIIDEPRVYNAALTPAQIRLDMGTPVGNLPSAPGQLSAMVVSPSQINLLWTAATADLGVSAYLVERQDPGSTNFVQIGTTLATSYNDPGLLGDTNYSYRVRATDGQGHLGPYSDVATAFIGLTISPRVVALTETRTQQFSATATFGNVSVIWSVDGVAGGTATSGTINATGLYSPPSVLGSHTVTATTTDLIHTANATVYVTTYPGMFTFHNDNFRTGQNTNETVLIPANVNSANFGKLFSYPLDGMAFASPLYLANVNVPGKGFHNLVFVATENDSVYAFDADGLASNAIWQVSFINPAAGVTIVPEIDTGLTGDLPNGIGITSTPVINPSNNTLYVVAKTKEVSGNNTNYFQRLHALDIATGAEKFGGPVVIQGSVTNSSNVVVPFDPLHENQRAALLLANGAVYFACSSHNDVQPYYGWVIGYNATNIQQRVLLFNDAPDAGKAGIWMDGDGAACDAAGNLYVITGDGTMSASNGGKDYGDCFLKISPAGAVLDYFSPNVQTSLDASNLDLGAGGVLLLPDQSGAHPHEMVSAAKNGTIYLVDRDNMGHYHSNTNQIVQTISNIFLNNLGEEGGNFSSPVYFNGNVYFAPVESTVQAFQLSNGLLTTTPTSHSAEVYSARGGAMAVSAKGATNGILWALESNGATAGILHAYDATNLGNELYRSDQVAARDALGFWWKFSLPLIANGKVFVATTDHLMVYGLLP